MNKPREEKIKKYLIDDEEADMHDIIHKAEEYGYEGFVKQTSVAAGILREHGHKVEENPNFKEQK